MDMKKNYVVTKLDWWQWLVLILLVACICTGIAIVCSISALNGNIEQVNVEKKGPVTEEKVVTNSTTSKDDASLSFLMAQDEEKSIILRDTCYLNAISRDPGNSTYFEEYVSFLDKNNMEYAYYYNLYSLLVSKAYEADSTELVVIDSEITLLDEKLGCIIAEADAKATTMWNEKYKDFIALADDEPFSIDRFNTYSDALVSLYSLITDPTDETQNEYEYVLYLKSLGDTYFRIDGVASFIINNFSEDVFESFYSIYCQMYTEALSDFVTRDETYDAEYSLVIKNVETDILNKNKAISNLYEKLLIKKAEMLFPANTNKLKENYKSLSNLSPIISVLSEFSSSEALEIIQRYYALSENTRKQMFSEYQKKASKILSKVDAGIKNVDKKEKLKYLFQNGFFNIDTSLLIPQLLTWYNSFDIEKIKKDSTSTYAILITSYPISQLTLEDMVEL